MGTNNEPAIIEFQVRHAVDNRELLLHRIRDLEMDNEILKQQLIRVTAEMRQSFMELAEKIDTVDSKLCRKLEDSTAVLSPAETIKTSSTTAESQKFDALTYVETVMETSEIISSTEVKAESPVNTEESSRVGPAEAEQVPDLTEALPPPPVTTASVSTADVDANNNEIVPSFNIPSKRYCCTICDKTFCQSSGLSRHHKIHLKQQQANIFGLEKLTKPKRFFCTALHCRKGFTSRSGMTKHAKSVHRDPSIKPTIIPLVDLQSSMSSVFLLPVEPLIDFNGRTEEIVKIDPHDGTAVVAADTNEAMDV